MYAYILVLFLAVLQAPEEEYFPKYVKAHIDRGIILLEQEARYGDDLLIHLTELEKGI